VHPRRRLIHGEPPLAARAATRARATGRLLRAAACWLALQAACVDEASPSFPRFIESLSDAGPVGCPVISPGSGVDCTRRDLVCAYPKDVQCACGPERGGEFGATVWTCFGGETAACPGAEPRPDSVCKESNTVSECEYGDRSCACDEPRLRWSCWRRDKDCPETLFASNREPCPIEGARCEFGDDGGIAGGCLCRNRSWSCVRWTGWSPGGDDAGAE
jgi:hypothetical protein